MNLFVERIFCSEMNHISFKNINPKLTKDCVNASLGDHFNQVIFAAPQGKLYKYYAGA